MGKDNWNFNLPLFVSSIHAGLHFVITACLMHFFPDKFDARRSGKGGRLTIHSYVTQVVSIFFKDHVLRIGSEDGSWMRQGKIDPRSKDQDEDKDESETPIMASKSNRANEIRRG
jgi:hypothetical protein